MVSTGGVPPAYPSGSDVLDGQATWEILFGTYDVRNGMDHQESKKALLGLEEVKAGELAILRSLDSFCGARGLSYSLCGGTLLGAVRHGGFIPWDDDVDIAMPRPAYDGLIRLAGEFRERTGYRVEGYLGVPLEESPLLKVVDPAVRVKGEMEHYESNLWVDVVPVDGLPESAGEVSRIYSRAGRARTLLFLAGASSERGRNAVRRAVKRAFGPVARIPAVKRMLARRLNEIGKAVPYGSTPYVGAVTWGMYGAGERMPLGAFDEKVRMGFEGEPLPCPSCWDEYLRGIYGDYMTPPEEGKRASHGITAWRV